MLGPFGLIVGLVFAVLVSPALANETGQAAGAESVVSVKRGRVTNLPIPRFVSFKAGAVNLRVGPGRQYEIAWLYKKRGLPVEVIQEFDRWRRIRDADGTTGWVLHSLLSSRRTALVAPWDVERDDKGKVLTVGLHEGHRDASRDARVAARLQAGVLADLEECKASWCRIAIGDHRAWIDQQLLWGTYPGEIIEE